MIKLFFYYCTAGQWRILSTTSLSGIQNFKFHFFKISIHVRRGVRWEQGNSQRRRVCCTTPLSEASRVTYWQRKTVGRLTIVKSHLHQMGGGMGKNTVSAIRFLVQHVVTHLPTLFRLCLREERSSSPTQHPLLPSDHCHPCLLSPHHTGRTAKESTVW